MHVAMEPARRRDCFEVLRRMGFQEPSLEVLVG